MLQRYVDLTGLSRFKDKILVEAIIESGTGANITETNKAPSVSATYNYVQGEISDVVDQMNTALGAKLSEVKYDSTNKKITAKNGTTKDVVTVDTLRSDMDAFGASGSNHKKGLVPDPGSTAGTSKFLREDATWAVVSTTDTKNTAGATDTPSKIYIIGATSQDANPQTYSHDTAYVGTDGCLYSNGQKVLTQHQDISGKADKATTLAGYGITDAKIANGTITLGSSSITPITSHQDISGKADKASITAGTAGTSSATSGSTLAVPYVTMNAQGIVTGYGTHTHTVTGFLTSHQDISGKADKATTLAGYGITDAKIENGVITLGSNTITPITSHQSLSGYVPTSRTVNGKALSSNISLTAADVGAIGVAQNNNFTAYQTFSAGSDVTSSTSISGTPAAGSIRVVGGIASTGGIKGSEVYNAVWNDLADSIVVDDEADLEFGYCYCFDGEHYKKSSKYLDDGIIGIHSDTAGFVMGTKGVGKEMQVAVAGFALAYVDREYKPGTPLTCTCCGMLTEIHKQDKMENPEKIVATYWKPESSEEWGSDDRKVEVNGRHWVKVK